MLNPCLCYDRICAMGSVVPAPDACPHQPDRVSQLAAVGIWSGWFFVLRRLSCSLRDSEHLCPHMLHTLSTSLLQVVMTFKTCQQRDNTELVLSSWNFCSAGEKLGEVAMVEQHWMYWMPPLNSPSPVPLASSICHFICLFLLI